MIKTAITNNLHTGRHVRWANTWIDAGETVVLDGAYPDASNSRKAQQMCESEMESGAISIMYVTDVKTVDEKELGKELKALRKRKSKEAAKARKEKEKAAKEAREAAEEAKKARAEAEEAANSEEEGEDEDMFTKGSIDEVLGRKTDKDGITISETAKDGETAKLAKRMEMDVSTVDADDGNKKNVGDPLLNAGTVAGQTPEITPAAQKAIDESGITEAETTMIEATGKGGKIIAKDVQAYLKSKE